MIQKSSEDIDFVGTLRGAASQQKFREKNLNIAVSITKEDFRFKSRKGGSSFTILFVVDASRSMNGDKKMSVVKGAIIAMLEDAYQKRDRVGMITFKQDHAEELLPITRSVKKAEYYLRTLPTGGKTPLSCGLQKGFEVVHGATLRDPKTIPVLIVVTDGKANVGLKDGLSIKETIEESNRVAEHIKKEGIKAMVIDTEEGLIKLGLAMQLADAMGATYLRLSELEGPQLGNRIQKELPN